MMPEGLVKCADPGLRRLPPLLTPFLLSGSRSRCTRASFPSSALRLRARCAFRPWKQVHALLTRVARSQIKVRDFSRAQVTLQPAEYASWSEARSELMVEAKKPHKCVPLRTTHATSTMCVRNALMRVPRCLFRPGCSSRRSSPRLRTRRRRRRSRPSGRAARRALSTRRAFRPV